MIKCKEDLKGKYVERGNKEIVELFLDACEKFGLKWYGGDNPREFEPYMSRIGVEFDLTLRQGFVGDCYSSLTLSDFKRHRTEYEKVTESIFDLRDQFERGELYTKCRGAGGDFFNKITTEYELVTFAPRSLYRKVEKEIDWREEVSNFVDDKYSYITIYENGAVDALLAASSNINFLELCRVALRANGEIE